MLTAIESRRLNRGLSGHSPIASVSVTSALGSAGSEHPLGRLQRERDSTPDAAVNFAFTLADPTPEQPPSQGGRTYTRIEDVVYGHRDGLAMTMDVFTPTANPNGAGVIIFVSAEYKSGRDLLLRFHPTTSMPFLDRGYVVFQVMHCSQPKYTVLEIVEDAHRAVRFIKYNAKKYGIDPAKIGVAGASSGGHLSLMMGCAGAPLNPKAADPVDRESSRAAAVACYFPPTDFVALADTTVKEEITGCGLRLMSIKKDTNAIPIEGKNLIVVANVEGVLQFRIFDQFRKTIVDADEAKFPAKALEIAALKKQLMNLWPPAKLTEDETERVIFAAASIVGQTHIAAPFDFRELDPSTGLLERVSAKRRLDIARDLSPITHATKEAAPTLIVHGDKDKVVPIAQSEAMIKKLKESGVESKLLVKKGERHFEVVWVVKELPTLADWFDIHLLGKKLPEQAVPQQPPVSVTTPKTISDCSCPHENETHYAPLNWGNSCVPLGNRSNVERNRIGWMWKLRQK